MQIIDLTFAPVNSFADDLITAVYGPATDDAPADVEPAADHTADDADWWAEQNDDWHDEDAPDFDRMFAESEALDRLCAGCLL